MARCFLSLGSNLGDRRKNISDAIVFISEKAGKILGLSGYYETEPWGFLSDSKFINAVTEIETNLSPSDLLQITKEIEIETGRKEKSVDGAYKDRIIDIDILFYDHLIVESDELTIPHPLLHKRQFVLLPLSETGNDFIHPVYNKTIGELLEASKSQMSAHR